MAFRPRIVAFRPRITACVKTLGPVARTSVEAKTTGPFGTPGPAYDSIPLPPEVKEKSRPTVGVERPIGPSLIPALSGQT